MVFCPGVRFRTGGEFLVVGVTFLCCQVSSCVVQGPHKGHLALTCLLPYSLRLYFSQQLVITAHSCHPPSTSFWYFICLFILAALDLCCFALAFSSSLEWGTGASLCSGFSACAACTLGSWALVSSVGGLSCSQAHGIFLDQGWTCVPCTVRQILNPWTTREVFPLLLTPAGWRDVRYAGL